MTDAANRFAASEGLSSKVPARLAVGFGLEARPAFDRIHPGRWQAVIVGDGPARSGPPLPGAGDSADKLPAGLKLPRRHRIV
jgi:hypothetical protein